MATKQITSAFDTLYHFDYIGMPVNALWRENILRWRYLYNSFSGGNDYRRGEYLVKYVLEDTSEYTSRIENTALDNHCKSVIDTYNAFLFRKPPHRRYGSIENDPAVDQFLDDADLEGRSWDAFMRDASTLASVYGVCWIICDKPETQVGTRAEELAQGIRPYVSLITPENVINWDYVRQPNGLYTLNYFQVIENYSVEGVIYREFTPEVTRLVERVRGDDSEVRILEETPNPIGSIPVVPLYAQRGFHRGIGVSDITDVADIQRSIYNEMSELEQNIRLAGHPSLVKTDGTEASAGAGAIITLEQGMDPGLKPYLLQPSGASIESLLKSMESKVESINRMANMSGIRSKMTQAMSGLALETEFQLLNARLSTKADQLELAEEQIWRIWARWQGQVWDGEIDYPDSFNIHDRANTVKIVQEAQKANPQDPELRAELDRMLARALIDDEDRLNKILDKEEDESAVEQPDDDSETHPEVKSPSELVAHMREMIDSGMSDQEIIQRHPELASFFAN